jgi:HK97 family phage major capsid protein
MFLKSKLDKAKFDLEQLRAKDEDFATREAELEQAIGEITEETPNEYREELENQVNAFHDDKEAHDNAKGVLETEIEKIEGEIAEEEKRSAQAIKKVEKRDEGRKETMSVRTKFYGMNAQERDAFFAREDVKDFLQRARELAGQKRSVTGAELLIPTVVLDLIKENVLQYSKLYKHVNVRSVSGKARQNVMGTIPEAVWTEMCATLNEMDLSFTSVEVDGYKVGGYIAICNAVLEDSDINLATEIISALGQAIGLALDKAILYGTGTKMPTGIVTKLVKEKNDTNVISISGKTDAQLFKELVNASGKAKGVYSKGVKFWTMNEATYTKLIANALTINAAGAITAGINGTMPVIGGAIEVLNFIPDDVIIGGYGDLYLLVERAGTSLAQSEHVRFLEEQTVFKGSARYDGVPVIVDGFVAIGIGGSKPLANAVSFTADSANSTSAEMED